MSKVGTGQCSVIMGCALTLALLPILLIYFTWGDGKDRTSAVEMPVKHRIYPKDFVEYVPGTVGIILSSPHGGYLNVSAIPQRVNGCITNENECLFENDPSCASKVKLCRVNIRQDEFTQEITRMVADGIEERLGRRPYMVLSLLHRSKLDPNRAIEEAAQTNTFAEDVYNVFHDSINEAKKEVGTGFLIDMHGQRHFQNSSELGYLISTEDLDREYYYSKNTSIWALSERTGHSGKELIAGPKSLGAMLEEEGYRALPSPRQPFPNGDKYLRGGFITRYHGSLHGGSVDAIQIEMPQEVRMDGGHEERVKFATAFAGAIIKFHEAFYKIE